MLAVGFEADIAQDDHLVIGGGLLEGGGQQGHRVFVVSGKELLIGPHDAPGRVLQPLPVRVVSGPFDQRANGGLRLRPARPTARA